MPFPVSRLARYELRRFRGVMPKVALIFVLIVPLLYGAIYLGANWDPYGKLKHLPVAVVNHDQPVVVDGRTLDAGADLVSNLHAGNAFDWQDSTDADAAYGLAHGTFYLTLTIPADFSANLVSGSGDHPQRAQIDLRRNDANGFVVGNITNSAQNTITRAVDESAQESYFDAVFANLATIRSSLGDASDGSADLADGLQKAHGGAGKLATGSADAMTGAKDLSSGATSLATGLDSASTGADSLARGLIKINSGSADLATGARKVAGGTQRLDDAVVPTLTELQQTLPGIEKDAKSTSARLATISDQVASGSSSVAGDLGQASDDLAALKKAHPELADDPAFQRVTKRVGSAAGRADDIAENTRAAATTIKGINTTVQRAGGLTGKVTTAKNDLVALNKGAHRVADGAESLHGSIGTASSGASSLATGVHKADNGAEQLASGSDQLYAGVSKVHDGAVSLDTGLGTLSKGATKLHAGLAKGVARIPAISPAQQADAVQVLSAPAQVQTTVDNPATYNGRGMAPLFLAIALWVFGISVFLVVRPINGRTLAGRANPIRLALAAWAPVGAIATAAGWLMVGVVWLFLGLDPVHPVAFIAAVTLGALAFSAIAHLLRIALGTAGSSLLLVLLILQLCASGGTYPAALLPPFFADIGPFLPLTYLINAYRITISGGLTGYLARDLLILLGVLVVTLGLIVVVVRRRQQFRMADLHPPLTAP